MTVKPPLVSILVPAFNAERYLRQTLKSALSQSWKSKEIIVVDDGSTDGTLSLARRFESKRLKVITQKNSGASAARNRALQESQGEYIQYLDADDLMDERKIELQLSLPKYCGDSDLCTCSSFYFYFNPKDAISLKNSLWKDLSAEEWLLRAARYGHWLPPHAWLVPRKAIEKAGPWDERLSLNDDGEYFFRLVANCCYVKFCPESSVFYRRANMSSLSSQRSRMHLESLFSSVELSIAQLFAKLEKEVAVEVARYFIQYNVDKFKIEDSDILKKFVALSENLGGCVRPPTLSRKYRWTKVLVGKPTAELVATKLDRLNHRIYCYLNRRRPK